MSVLKKLPSRSEEGVVFGGGGGGPPPHPKKTPLPGPLLSVDLFSVESLMTWGMKQDWL